MTLLLFAVGLLMLVVGAEALVHGASQLAARIGWSPLVIGLTVVAYGTSTPELAVSVFASFAGRPDVAVGNVVGSNIFNVLFILGISALIAPLAVSQRLVRLDVPLMIAASVAMFLMGLDGTIGRGDGLVLCAAVIAYTGFLVRQSRGETRAVQEEYAHELGTVVGTCWRDSLRIVGGIALLVLGSRWLVEGAVAFARRLGVSELVIGLTIVAAGTSLPEVATSVVASLRGERDIAVGNVIGSNLFNILAVLGAAAAVSPHGVAVSSTALHFDIPVMIAVAVSCLPIFFTGNVIARWEGALFLAYYGAYGIYLVLAARHHAALQIYATALLWLALPITVLTLAIASARAARRSPS